MHGYCLWDKAWDANFQSLCQFTIEAEKVLADKLSFVHKISNFTAAGLWKHITYNSIRANQIPIANYVLRVPSIA